MVDIRGTQRKPIKSIEVLASAPTPSEGRIYYDSTLNKLRFYI